ncbi:hypothetical protein LCGC14_1707550, partial [marine sediment metagenome]
FFFYSYIIFLPIVFLCTKIKRGPKIYPKKYPKIIAINAVNRLIIDESTAKLMGNNKRNPGTVGKAKKRITKTIIIEKIKIISDFKYFEKAINLTLPYLN